MIRHQNWFWIVALAFVCGACSDDSSGSSGGNNNGDQNMVGEGESCGGGKECISPFVCTNGVCAKKQDGKLGKACTNDAMCGTGLKCDNNICKTVADPGQACDNTVYCKDSICEGGVCTKVSRVGKPCDETVICKDSTCEDGFCRSYGGEGADCDAIYKLCESGLDCSIDGKCYRPRELGESCDEMEQFCAAAYSCSLKNSVCVKTAGYGEDCGDDIFAECNLMDGYECIEGKCRGYSFDETCDEYHLCQDGKVCFDKHCINQTECESDDDCKADTYCCTEDACDVKNVCVPYEDGPRGEVNEACQYKTVQGLFEADVQCEWTHTDDASLYPGNKNVLMTPLVMNTPHDSGNANEIIFTAYNCTDGGAPSSSGSDPNCYGVIRIINAETCALQDSIFDNANRVIGGSNLAMADLDGDGNVEIVAGRGSYQPGGAAGGGGLVVFKWDNESGRYVTKCNTTNHSGTTYWGGPAIHDINNDGMPELISYGGQVFDANCNRLNPGQSIDELSYTATLGDLDKDSKVEIIGTGSIYRWNTEASRWDVAYSGVRSTGIHEAFADFGTLKEDGSFDFENLDGIAETVGCGSGVVELSTLTGKKLMRITGVRGGGPCTIGDFDGDKLPEIATAFGDQYRVYDPRCTRNASGALPEGCIRDYTLWETVSQDASSESTGSSLFDFDGDGKMEAVYADECFTRVYDGSNGKVLFSSHHTSCTWHEYPIIADVDNDESAEIIVGSNNNCDVTCHNGVETTGPDGRVYAIDPIHHGLNCVSDADCYSNVCINGLCRCTDYLGCNSKTDANGKPIYENGCVAALTAAEQADGLVCRAIHPQVQFMTGVRVLRDRLDRWTSSRNLWNQHAYSITNINDDQTIPKTENWTQNFLTPGLNNFRQNVQGERGNNSAPDITCKLDKDNLCVVSSDSNALTLTGVICNRGTKMVASRMPASFYDFSDGTLGNKYCTAYTETNVPVGGCLAVSCTLEDTDIAGKTIRMIANDDGNGGKTTVECNENNNTDEVTIDSCQVN